MARGTDDFDSFLRQVDALDRGALLALSARPESVQDAEALEVARQVATEAAEASGQTSERERLRDRVAAWAHAGGARAGMYAPDGAAMDVGLEDLRLGAAQAIFDAATVRLLGDALDEDSAAALTYRWDSVCG